MKNTSKRRRRARRERLAEVIAAARRRDSSAVVAALIAIVHASDAVAMMEEITQLSPETLMFVLPHIELRHPEDDSKAIELEIGLPHDAYTWVEEVRLWIDRDSKPWRPEGRIGPLKFEARQ